MKEHGLIHEKKLQSSRRGNVFHHVKRRKDLLGEDPNDPTIAGFYGSLAENIREGRRGA